MIRLSTNDKRIEDFCDFWNSIPQVSNVSKKIHLFNGVILNEIVIQIKIPLITINNFSLRPRVNYNEKKTTMILPFYLPNNLDNKYDISIILSVMTSLIVDTLSVYSSITPMDRYWLEETLQQKNRYLMSHADRNHDLKTFLSSFDNPVLFMEMRLSEKLNPIPDPRISEMKFEEEISHISHKARLTEYTYIASKETVMLPPSLLQHITLEPIIKDKSLFVSRYNEVTSHIQQFPIETKFFSYIKHIFSSKMELQYFPKGSLKELGAKQLQAIAQSTRINNHFNKNKPIETSLTQMIIINFYLAIKKKLLTNEFTRVIREEAVPINVHEQIFQISLNSLPSKVISHLKDALKLKIDWDSFSLESLFPNDLISLDPISVDNLSEEEKQIIRNDFEKLSRYHITLKAEQNISSLQNIETFLTHMLSHDKYLNTILAYYTSNLLQKGSSKIISLADDIENVYDNIENIEDVIELLFMNILNRPTSYGQISKASDEKIERLSKNITGSIDIIEPYIQKLLELIDWQPSLSISHLNEESVHKLIYILIGYYFNFHHTVEILQKVKQSQIPSCGDPYLPLVESYPMTFNHSFNAFRPKSFEFSEDEHKKFNTLINSIWKNLI